MIKSYQSFLESKQDIDSICRKYGIQNYTINEDGSIDVDGDVDLSDKNLNRIPLKFKNVSGYFNCVNNKLTSLVGAPQTVGGDFDCFNNKLTSLESAPKNVGGDFYCFNNKLTSLEGGPKSVGGNFYCYNNKLATLEGSPQRLEGFFHCSDNQLKDFRGFPEFWEGEINFYNNPVQDILNQFPEELWCKVIYWINEYDAIDKDGKVIEDRMDEVKYQLGL